MRPKRMPAPALARILVASTLLAAAACTSGQAAPSARLQDGQSVGAMRGYGCAPAAAGRYRCARSLDRDAQREAGAVAPASCSSCGNALAR